MKIRSLLPWKFFLALTACGSDPAQPPSAETALLTAVVPDLWVGGPSRRGSHEVGFDTGIRRSGRYAAYIRSMSATQDTTAFGALLQDVSAVGYRGQRIRFSGWVRPTGVTAPGGGLWARVDGATRTLAFDNMLSPGRAVVGTKDWHQVSLVLDVPANALGITFGALLNGSGIIRVDDLQLEVVPATVPLTGSNTPGPETPADSAQRVSQYERAAGQPINLDFEGAPGISAAASVWMGATAKPFVSDEPGTDVSDLAEIGSIAGNARLVALGEATHGTREFFRMKHRVFQYLVQTRGFSHFQIEATMPEARAVDRYVVHGEGDPSRLLADLKFWTWNTDEVLELIQWMRAWNLKGTGPVLRFHGNDMQFPVGAADSVVGILGRVDPPQRDKVRAAYACLAEVAFTESRYAQLSAEQRRACLAGAQAVADTLARLRSSYPQLSADDGAWLEQYARLVFQWARMAGDRTVNWRDQAMAENATWLANREPGSRHFLWAHNGHISRKPQWMGAALHRIWGAQYRNIAFTFGTGRFNAVNNFLGVQTINVIPPSSIETVFAGTQAPRLILDTRKVIGAPDAAAFDRRPVLMRSIGAVYSFSVPDNFFEQAVLPVDYDGIIWFANTSQSKLRPFP